MPKQNTKQKYRSAKKSQRSNKSLRGGTSDACVLPYASNAASANIHNSNPQAAYDLDSKFSGYGGPVPLGSNIVSGGGSCGDSGVGTANPKTETFKQYLESVNKRLDISKGGARNNSRNKKGLRKSSKKSNSRTKKHQRGSGYVVDPSEFIAGQPVYKHYDDFSPPAIIGGQMQFSSSPEQPLCGPGATSATTTTIASGGNRNRKSKNHKNHKNRKNRKNNTKHRGGDFTSFGSSKPAEFNTAFTGEPSVLNYPEDMSKRTFNEVQPFYSPNAI